VNIYVHYGQSRPKEANFIGQNEIVLTTYGVVASEFSTEVTSDNL
jgi:DNA repair protein RAD5